MFGCYAEKLGPESRAGEHSNSPVFVSRAIRRKNKAGKCLLWFLGLKEKKPNHQKSSRRGKLKSMRDDFSKRKIIANRLRLTEPKIILIRWKKQKAPALPRTFCQTNE